MRISFRTPVYSRGTIRYVDNELFLKEGRINALLGRNGSGKTTIFNSLLGLEKNTKFSIAGFKYEDVFLYSQNIRFPPDLRIFEIIRILVGCDKRQTLKFMRSFSDYVTANHLKDDFFVPLLAEVWERKFHQLSLGEQKLLFCHIMSHMNRKLFIIDELTSGIDPANRTIIIKILKKIAEKAFVLFSTHIPGELEGTDASVSYVDEQKIVFTKPLASIDFDELYLQTSS